MLHSLQVFHILSLQSSQRAWFRATPGAVHATPAVPLWAAPVAESSLFSFSSRDHQLIPRPRCPHWRSGTVVAHRGPRGINGVLLVLTFCRTFSKSGCKMRLIGQEPHTWFYTVNVKHASKGTIIKIHFWAQLDVNLDISEYAANIAK